MEKHIVRKSFLPLSLFRSFGVYLLVSVVVIIQNSRQFYKKLAANALMRRLKKSTVRADTKTTSTCLYEEKEQRKAKEKKRERKKKVKILQHRYFRVQKTERGRFSRTFRVSGVDTFGQLPCNYRPGSFVVCWTSIRSGVYLCIILRVMSSTYNVPRPHALT